MWCCVAPSLLLSAGCIFIVTTILVGFMLLLSFSEELFAVEGRVDCMWVVLGHSTIWGRSTPGWTWTDALTAGLCQVHHSGVLTPLSTASPISPRLRPATVGLHPGTYLLLGEQRLGDSLNCSPHNFTGPGFEPESSRLRSERATDYTTSAPLGHFRTWPQPT